MSLGDLSLACVRLLVDELVRGGVRHACVSPGSRSTPVALALARHGDVTVHVHLDERSSGFFALGIAKATGAPVAVACTSGTAAAELLPAAVEASQGRQPLILLTADRPPRLRGTGANQTIDQPGLYGSYVRASIETPLPWPGDGDVWRRLGAEAVRACTAAPPGPVHVNLPFEEPLTPTGEDVSVADAGPVRSLAPLSPRVSAHDVQRLSALFASTDRGVVVIGSSATPPLPLLAAAASAGWPVVAEPLSGVRIPGVLSAGQSLLAQQEWLERATPAAVLQAGASPTTRVTQAFVAAAGELMVVDAHHLDPDPEERAAAHLHADPGALAAAIEPGPLRESEWLDTWLIADGRARTAMDRFLDDVDDPFEPRVARDLAAWTPVGTTLFVGNSTPIRDLDLAMAPREGPCVLANRGASGIDGLLSTALGIATQTPTVASLGDLSLLHDSGALLWSGRAGHGPDLIVVVIRNGGGEVFSLLAQRELPEHRELFTTPYDLDLEALCAAARCGWRCVERAGDLTPALDAASVTGGVQVVEVRVDPVRGLELRGELDARIAAALA